VALTLARPQTLGGTFSFYVPASDPVFIVACEELADAVTVKGPTGPAVIAAMRNAGWDGAVIFDRAGYNPKVNPIDAERWFDEQASAGADRLLTAGTWARWDDSGEALKHAIEIEAKRTALRPDTTAILAIDYRWLTRMPTAVVDAIDDLNGRVALVLAHREDPLSATGAVDGLRAIAASKREVTILRTDHGGLGGLVFGAQHAAIGLLGTYRHFVPPGTSGGGKPQRPRVHRRNA
jgi:hypothetical protein